MLNNWLTPLTSNRYLALLLEPYATFDMRRDATFDMRRESPGKKKRAVYATEIASNDPEDTVSFMMQDMKLIQLT
jgi:hypothetical protein